MKLKELYKSNKPTISFEVFPPEGREKLEKLCNEITVLEKFHPEFISLTYGAGGKNSTDVRRVLETLHNNFSIEIIPHFTCMCSSKSFIDENLEFLKNIGCENILALRGDKPADGNITCTDFCYANELVTYLKRKTNFSIAVAGYPEGHIESATLDEDITNLEKKIDAGADAIFTQLFFENEKFYEFREKLESKGIKTPIIAGIMPIFSLQQLYKMTTLARVTIPENFLKKIKQHENDKTYVRNLGIEFAIAQCRDLLNNNVKGLHFFTLNKSFSTSEILKNIL